MADSFITRRGGEFDPVFNNIPGNESLMNLVRRSNDVSIGRFALTIDDNFVYTSVGNRIFKYHSSNLSFIGNSSVVGPNGIMWDFDVDDTFIYAAGQQDLQRITKFYKSNLVVVGQSNTSNDTIRFIKLDNNFVYIAVNGTSNSNIDFAEQAIKQYHKGNLVFIRKSSRFFPGQFTGFTGMAIGGNFIYATTNRTAIRAYNKSNLILSEQFTQGVSNSITVDNDFIYARNISVLYKINKTTKNNVATTTISMGQGKLNIEVDNSFIYMTGTRVSKHHKNNLAFINQTLFHTHPNGFGIEGLAFNNNFIYTTDTTSGFGFISQWNQRGPATPRILFEGNNYVKQ